VSYWYEIDGPGSSNGWPARSRYDCARSGLHVGDELTEKTTAEWVERAAAVNARTVSAFGLIHPEKAASQARAERHYFVLLHE
jgi:hypothetical protein